MKNKKKPPEADSFLSGAPLWDNADAGGVILKPSLSRITIRQLAEDNPAGIDLLPVYLKVMDILVVVSQD